MTRRILALAALVSLSAAATLSLAAPAPWRPKSAAPAPASPKDKEAAPSPANPRPNISYVDGLPDTAGVFLPESTVLARVDERRLTAREFIETYYNAYALDRPGRDSTGRVEWLNSMVNKEVLGRVARAANRPLTFEDRLVLRQHRQRVLSNVLFARAVMDSIVIRGEAVRAVYPQYLVEHHLRRMSFLDPATAQRARSDVVAKRIRWEDAARRYRLPEDDAGADGDIGWRRRAGMSAEAAAAIYAIKPGEISRVVTDDDGTFIFQSLEARGIPAGDRGALGGVILRDLRAQQIKQRAEDLQAALRREIGMRYDTTNIVYASGFFELPISTEVDQHGTSTVRIRDYLPEFTPADTGRVVARWEEGQMSLGGFLHEYMDISPFRRAPVTTLATFCRQIDAFALEPSKARLAEKRGLENDSLAVSLMEKERERILVEHLYSDSIEAKISISPAERRKYYQAHLGGFYTFQRARYATLAAPDSAAAAALAERLRKGERADEILRADSIAGRDSTGAIHEESENESSMFHAVVFGALKPGEFQILGPGRKGLYAVIQLLSMDPGRQLSFEESDAYADDALQSLAAEERLRQFLARHKQRFRIETHPELVGRIRLVDPEAEAILAQPQ